MPALTTAHAFCVKHRAQITGVRSCCDRVIFRGYLPLSYPQGMSGFLYQQQVLLKDFKDYAPQVAERVQEHVKALVEQAGAPYRHLPTKERMEDQARRLAQKTGIREGIVCGFAQRETGRSFRFAGSASGPRLRPDFRRCLVLYVFVMHAVLGLMHVQIHTWFPLTMQVHVNGHDFLAKKLDALGVAYTRCANTFTALADGKVAQHCADRFGKLNWPKLLDELARQFNPLVGKELGAQEYYWVMDQAEYAPDVLFQDAAALAGFSPRLVEHARTCLSAEDVLKFLGRKRTGHFQGQVQMYDKAGSVLRIETTINDPTAFRVRRRQAGRPGLQWQPLRKGVAWLWRYAEVSRAANSRYLQALAIVDDDSQAPRLVDRVTHPAKLNGRWRRALQPLSPAEQQLFLAVLRGEHRLRGFRNQDVAQRLSAHATQDPGERRRRCARVTRLIQLLRAHGLVAKIPRTRRYRVTVAGERFLSAAIQVKEVHLPKTLNIGA